MNKQLKKPYPSSVYPCLMNKKFICSIPVYIQAIYYRTLYKLVHVLGIYINTGNECELKMPPIVDTSVMLDFKRRILEVVIDKQLKK